MMQKLNVLSSSEKHLETPQILLVGIDPWKEGSSKF